MESKSGVADYYERNTRRFLVFGGGGAAGTMHRELWADGVTNAIEAQRYVHQLLAEDIARCVERNDAVLLDLGCGVGGSMIELAQRFPQARICGVTNSERQVRLAQIASKRAGVSDRAQFELGDFERLQLGVQADLAYAVESFVHSSEPACFFASTARHVVAGGWLVLVDDFLARDRTNLAPMERRWVDDFRNGWRAPSFGEVNATAQIARAHGFELIDDRDLGKWLRLNRLRDRAVACVAPLLRATGARATALGGNFVGGHALTRGLKRGIFSYRSLLFRKAADR